MEGFAVWNIESQGFVLAVSETQETLGQYFVRVYLEEAVAQAWCNAFNDEVEPFYEVRKVTL